MERKVTLLLHWTLFTWRPPTKIWRFPGAGDVTQSSHERVKVCYPGPPEETRRGFRLDGAAAVPRSAVVNTMKQAIERFAWILGAPPPDSSIVRWSSWPASSAGT